MTGDGGLDLSPERLPLPLPLPYVLRLRKRRSVVDPELPLLTRREWAVKKAGSPAPGELESGGVSADPTPTNAP